MLKKIYFEMWPVCFFGSDELENDCLVVETFACAPKTFGIILAVSTYIIRYSGYLSGVLNAMKSAAGAYLYTSCTNLQ